MEQQTSYPHCHFHHCHQYLYTWIITSEPKLCFQYRISDGLLWNILSIKGKHWPWRLLVQIIWQRHTKFQKFKVCGVTKFSCLCLSPNSPKWIFVFSQYFQAIFINLICIPHHCTFSLYSSCQCTFCATVKAITFVFSDCFHTSVLWFLNLARAGKS